MLISDFGLELYESSTAVNPATKFSTSPRIRGGLAVCKAFAICSGEIFSAVATAAEARAFIKLCWPVIGKSAAAPPSGVCKRKRIEPNFEVSMLFAITSASFCRPKVITGPSVFDFIFITSGSSVFSTATPPGLSPSINSAFMAATFSIVPRCSRCTGATINSTPMSGGVICTSRRISCVGEDIPISSTAKS